MAKITVSNFNVQLEYGTDRTLLATWGWTGVDGEPIEKFSIEWQYQTGNGVWITDGAKDVNKNLRQNTFQASGNAWKVQVRVKPIGAKKKDSNGKETNERYLSNAAWTGWKSYDFNNKVYFSPPLIPSFTIPDDSCFLSGLEERTMCVDLTKAVSNVNEWLKAICSNVNERMAPGEVKKTLTVGSGSDSFKDALIAGYEFQWSYYDSANSKWIDQDAATSNQKLITYQYPSGVTHIRFKARMNPSTFKLLVDGKEYPCFTHYYCNWKTLVLSSFTPQPSKLEAMPSDYIEMQYAPGSTTDIQINWNRITEYTGLTAAQLSAQFASYDYQWSYKDRNDISHTESGNTAARNVTVTIPDSFVTLVKARIKPVSKTYTRYGTEWPYFTAKWSDWKIVKNLHELEPNIPVPKNNRGDEVNVTNIAIIMRRGATNIFYAKWAWSFSNTEGYEVEWKYDYGDGEWWFDDPQTVTTGTKSEFTLPDSSVQNIGVRIKPLCDYTYGYWKKEFTPWTEVPVNLEAQVPFAKKDVTDIKIAQYQDTTLYAVVNDWDQEHTDHFQYQWRHYVAGNVNQWFDDNVESSTSNVFPPKSFDANVTMVCIRVMPVAETYTDEYGRTDVPYWKAPTEWADLPFKEEFIFKMEWLDPSRITNPPGIDLLTGNYLKATVNNYNTTTAKQVEFEILQDHVNSIAFLKVPLNNGYAELKYRVPSDGHEYQVRARGVYGVKVGEWSEWSDVKSTGPKAPERLISAKAEGTSGVRVTWTPVDMGAGHESETLDIVYEIQYIQDAERFDVSSEAQTATTTSNTGFWIITFDPSSDFGKTWYFRVRSKLGDKFSSWTNILPCTIAKQPSIPTTWSESSTVGLGDTIRFYWVHNAEDNSNEQEATLTYYMSTDPTNPINIVITDTPSDEEESDIIHTYELETSTFTTGCLIFWKVKTKGAHADYSDYSVERQIGVYDNPAVAFTVPSVFTSFPISFTAVADPPQQTAIVWNISIKALEGYDSVDSMGNDVHIGKDQQIYSKFIDISGNTLSHDITAADVTFENGISYALTVTVGMDSGLMASYTAEFTTDYDFDVMEPLAIISFDATNYSASIMPYCYDSAGNIDGDVTLAVYRREYDGRFVRIATGLTNTGYTSVVDPHPALDYARYRVTATSKTTGRMTSSDFESDYIGIPGVVLQWGRPFDLIVAEDDANAPAWDGTTLHLPYNADVSEETDVDVALIDYIGRSSSVSYYGTQLGIASSINCVIRADDYETIYALRRLAIYRGNVYVRTSGGVGYWAQVAVSFQKTHREVTIPVTISLKRVEGGI